MQNTLRAPLVLSLDTQRTDQTKSVDQMLALKGGNTGNIMFCTATSGLFDNAVVTDYMVRDPGIAKDRDCVVIAAANWLSEDSDFGDIADALEALDLPIIPLGLGAQSTLDKRIPKLKSGTRRFVDLIAERSPMISARGIFSCEVLESYGAKNVSPTGCPSLLQHGAAAPSFRAKPDDVPLEGSSVVIHGTRHHFHKTDAFQNYLYREALAQGNDLLLQSELADFYFAMNRLNNAEIKEKAMTLLLDVFQSSPEVLETYLKEHGKVFFDLDHWLDYCRQRSFFLGTRIHGTIAGILAGTPSILITHDSRTVELADAMGVPSVRQSEVPTDRPLQPELYYDMAMDYDFEKSYRVYWDRFRDFFATCNLHTNLYSNS